MTARTARWGTLLLVLSVLVTVAIGTVAAGVGPIPPATPLRVVLPSLALALSVLVLFAGHLSYPRVQNLRVYLAGYSVGIQGIVYALVRGFDSFFIDSVPIAPEGFAELVLAFGILGTYAFSLLPAFPTFRATRATTWILVGLHAGILAVVRFMPASFRWLSAIIPLPNLFIKDSIKSSQP